MALLLLSTWGGRAVTWVWTSWKQKPARLFHRVSKSLKETLKNLFSIFFCSIWLFVFYSFYSLHSFYSEFPLSVTLLEIVEIKSLRGCITGVWKGEYCMPWRTAMHCVQYGALICEVSDGGSGKFGSTKSPEFHLQLASVTSAKLRLGICEVSVCSDKRFCCKVGGHCDIMTMTEV